MGCGVPATKGLEDIRMRLAAQMRSESMEKPKTEEPAVDPFGDNEPHVFTHVTAAAAESGDRTASTSPKPVSSAQQFVASRIQQSKPFAGPEESATDGKDID